MIELFQDTGLTSEDLGRMYYVPVAKREVFLEALKKKGDTGGITVPGVSFAVFDKRAPVDLL